MSQHYELVKIVKQTDNPNKIFLNWTTNLNGIKLKDQKWKHFPIVNTPKVLDGKYMDSLKNFKVYEDDVYICGYLRSGNTMMQEMVWLIVNDCDFATAKSTIRSKRVPYFDAFDLTQKFREGENYVKMEDMNRPRCFKSHLPIQCLPDGIWEIKPRIIHMSRDVKDVAVSMYYYLRDFDNIPDTFDDFIKDFIEDNIVFTPYREHVLNYKNVPDYSNILHLTYEYVTQNLGDAILRVAEFLGKKISNENFALLKEHLSFDTLKKNAAVNNDEYISQMNKLAGGTGKIYGQIRTGKIGGHKSEMSPEMVEKFNNWMREGLELNQGFLYNPQ